MTEIICKSSDEGKKLCDVLKNRGFSRRLITQLKRTQNGMTRMGKLVRTIDVVHNGDIIEICEQKGNPLEANENLNVKVLYEDDDIVVFDKPPFMPCHPSIKHQGDTLGNYFAFHCPNMTFRCINRLDRDTSGCVAVAKNQFAANSLQRSIDKKYYGIVENLKYAGGRIYAPIARQTNSIILRCVRSDGQESVTNYHRIAKNGVYSLVEFILETGRTHQIRCHMAYLGNPLLGDTMYGQHSELIARQALHCGEISFNHPVTKKKVVVKAPFPSDFVQIFNM